MLDHLAPAVLMSAALFPQGEPTSGRPIPPEQACFDVTSTILRVRVDPSERWIEGEVELSACFLAQSDAVVLDLDPALDVRDVAYAPAPSEPPGPVDWRVLAHERRGGEVVIPAAELFEREIWRVGGDFTLRVRYGGRPRVAPRPPWDGGFVWETTADGSPWIATANQMQGADLWWPCKDQPDDEPDEMQILVTVPEGLVCASNGRLREVREAEPGWTTYDWHVSTPINVYGVALNIAPYETITADYESVTGDTFPITYWVLPENLEKGKVLFADILRQTRWFEQTFGPYPFRRDKYGVAETPHLGMEHQTIIAYGNEYRGNPWGEDYGFDFLHHHEMAHEWWANLVTCRDWKDFWIHEGFATYAQALYVEALHGPDAYREWLASYRGTLRNEVAVAPREHRSTADVHHSPAALDIYYKGSWILHTLRWLVGDEDFFLALRRMAYPDPALEALDDGSACRFVDTEEIRAIAERHTGRDLGWFFEVYLRQPRLPRLIESVEGGWLRLAWEAPDGLSFPMPVEVRVGEELRRVDVPAGGATVELEGTEDFAVDPFERILKEIP